MEALTWGICAGAFGAGWLCCGAWLSLKPLFVLWLGLRRLAKDGNSMANEYRRLTLYRRFRLEKNRELN